MLIKKDEPAFLTMILATLVLITSVLITDPDSEFSNKANITRKGVRQEA